MEKSEILEVIKKAFVNNVEGLQVVDVDPSKTMSDMGADSIDIVQSVNAITKILEVDIPDETLGSLKTLGDLVDAITDIKSNS